MRTRRGGAGSGGRCSSGPFAGPEAPSSASPLPFVFHTVISLTVSRSDHDRFELPHRPDAVGAGAQSDPGVSPSAPACWWGCSRRRAAAALGHGRGGVIWTSTRTTVQPRSVRGRGPLCCGGRRQPNGVRWIVGSMARCTPRRWRPAVVACSGTPLAPADGGRGSCPTRPTRPDRWTEREGAVGDGAGNRRPRTPPRCGPPSRQRLQPRCQPRAARSAGLLTLRPSARLPRSYFSCSL